MNIVISLGDEFARHDSDGRLLDPEPAVMATAAFRGQRGEWFVPQRTWVKDFPGQVTEGRIGIPRIRYCPISWLGAKRAAEVLRLIEAR